MPNNLKILENKKTLICIIGIFFFLSLIPLHFAQAAWWNDLINSVVNFGTYILFLPAKISVAIITLGIFLVALFSGFIFFLIGGILASFIQETLSIKVIPGLDPSLGGISVVNTGWIFSRDFANMLLILILVFIGLATILKLREYEAKKALPLLILVALLINFSGVLVGFVVDMGNLVINFFIEKFAGFSVTNLKDFAWDIPFDYLKDTVWGLFTSVGDPLTEIGKIIGSILYGLAILLFFVFGAFIFFIVLLVFILRVIVLWILAILAPIAFLSRALPPTPMVKRLFPSILHWDEWWQQLIQWTIIGIPLGFFLVLSKVVFVEGVEFTAPSITDPGLGMWGDSFQHLGGFITNIFGPLIGLILMGVGVMIAIKTAPSGARGIMEWGKRTGIAAGRIAWKKGKSWTRERIAESERTQRAARRMALASTPGTGVPGWRGVLTRAAATPIWASMRRMGQVMGPGLIERQRAIIDQNERNITGQTVEAELSAFRQATTDAERLGRLQAIIKDKNIDDAMNVERFGANALTQAEVERLFEPARRYDRLKVIRSAFPEMARTHLPTGVPPPPPPPGISPAQHQAQYVFDRILPAEYKNMSRRVLGDNEFLEAMIRKSTDRHIHRFIDRFQMDGAIAFEERLRGLTANALGISIGQVTPAQMRQTLRNINPRLHRYFTRGAGQGLIHI